ncbi:putative Glutamine dumper 2 [Tripterygium wilfordii]|uniref:Putative Glutamine dumper 2 n=1 Tax=Tripterygium wilfordii TaxID=458696 RepID=A0A7J7BUM2_TRIWF|nr:putative Glutamine dumper 2 [Tripterygium wilfordii]
MRSENNTSTVSGGDTRLHSWGSPMPYFIGLAFMLGLIATALVILVCSNRNSPSQSRSQSQSQSQGRMGAEQVEGEVDSEPNIVVIMAGDDKPRYLAEPVSYATHIER